MNTYMQDTAELRAMLIQAFNEMGMSGRAEEAEESNGPLITAALLAMIKAYSRGREDMRREIHS